MSRSAGDHGFSILILECLNLRREYLVSGITKGLWMILWVCKVPLSGVSNGGREKTRVFQIMDFSFFVKKRGFAGGGSKSQNT